MKSKAETSKTVWISDFDIWTSNLYGCLSGVGRKLGLHISRLLLLRFFFIPEEVFELIHKFLNIFELTIDRGKADISHTV